MPWDESLDNKKSRQTGLKREALLQERRRDPQLDNKKSRQTGLKQRCPGRAATSRYTRQQKVPPDGIETAMCLNHHHYELARKQKIPPDGIETARCAIRSPAWKNLDNKKSRQTGLKQASHVGEAPGVDARQQKIPPDGIETRCPASESERARSPRQQKTRQTGLKPSSGNSMPIMHTNTT